MSATQPVNDCEISRRLTLDLRSFQKLLEAAWVIQCERDRVPGQLQKKPMAVASLLSEDVLPTIEVPNSSKALVRSEIPGVVAEQVGPPVALPEQKSDVVDTFLKRNPSSVQNGCSQPEVAGTLALAPVPRTLPASSRQAPDVTKKPASTETGNRESYVRPALSLVKAGDAQHALAKPQAIRPKRSFPAASLAAAILALFVMISFLTFELAKRSSTISVRAASPSPVTESSLSVARQGNPPSNSANDRVSHLRVTDSDVSSQLEELSPFEMRTIRRQAKYGDDSAALALGMAYEIGAGLPQNCTQAAQWVLIAAQNGNLPAQYNLALRYASGDGVSDNPVEASRWMRQAARNGYRKAQTAIKSQDFPAAQPKP